MPPDSTAAAISRKGVERVHSGHPWIYRSDLTREPNLPAGGEARVLDQRGHFVALAAISPRSKTRCACSVRKNSRSAACSMGRGRALELRERLFPGVDGLRLVNGEVDLFAWSHHRSLR